MLKVHIHLIVPAKLVGPLVELLEDEPGVTLQFQASEGNTSYKHKVHTPRHFAPNGKSGLQIITDYMKAHKTFTSAEISKEFLRHGLNANSAGPRCSEACSKGLLRLVSRGNYEVTAKGANNS